MDRFPRIMDQKSLFPVVFKLPLYTMKEKIIYQPILMTTIS